MDLDKRYNVKHDYHVSVSDLAWNPGENLLLALFVDGAMGLISLETLTFVMIFEKQSVRISSVAWMDNISGEIVTASTKIGALKIWSSATDSPKDMIKVGPHGIAAILPLKLHSSSTFLLQLKNGQVVVYNLRKR